MATTNLTNGQAVIDLGNFGKLILPVEVDGGHWFYYWDRSGDGTNADAGVLNGGVDFLKQSDLIALFKQDVNNSTNASGATDNTYRYGWLNDVHLALPTVGGVAFPPYGYSGLGDLASGTSIGSSSYGSGSNTTNTVYNDYLAIWDAYDGTPPGWAIDSPVDTNHYWTATPAGSVHSTVTLWAGYVGGRSNAESNFHVVLASIES